MTEFDQNELATPQREVQRLLGRCLLRLQQYEHLLKTMVALQEMSGSPQTFERMQEARIAEASDKTLGTLIGRLLGNYIVPEGSEPPDQAPAPDNETTYFKFRMQLSLRNDLYNTLKADLRELVTLRNTLVHHFIDHHDLWTVDGCLRAQDALTSDYAEIERHFEQLRTYAGYMDDAKLALAQRLQTPEVIDFVVNGIDQDGVIRWPMAGIVCTLREAFRELAVDGWVNLDAAARWVSEHYPEQTPQKYGCSRWRHVIHESGQFELRRFTHNGQFGAWFRDRPTASR